MLKNVSHDSRKEALLIAALLILLLLQYAQLLGTLSLYALIAGAVIGVIPVFLNAWRSLREREWASMDTLASVALIFSMLLGEWTSAVFIALMLAAARLLEIVTEERMERSIRGLMKLRPTTAKVENDGQIVTVRIEDISIGDIILSDTGERIAIDGIVISGEAAVDESSLTGESLPVDKSEGSTVASSSLVSSGSIRIRTTRVGKDTTLERIISLVESSQEQKPDIETLGERFGKIYLIGIFFGAALLLLFTKNLQLVLAVVLVVCADDVAVAIPLAYLRAIGTAAKRGIVIKGGKHLEALGRVHTIVFDKTGTLTRGKPVVTAAVTSGGITEDELLSFVVTLSARSQHPLSRALFSYSQTKGAESRTCTRAEVIGGRGIIGMVNGTRVILGNRKFLEDRGISLDATLIKESEGFMEQGMSLSFISRGEDVLGFVALSDEVKQNAKTVIGELRNLGVEHILMLSGDNERAAGWLARELGLDGVFANLLPEDKVRKVKELSEEGVLVMVGDGVNDAAALSIAHVGIAMGGLGSDGAIESADIVLMHDNLDAIPNAIELARSVRRISVQDFWIWGASNVMGLALVFLGFIGPAGAAAYNFISDFFPLFNSVRARIKT